MGTQSRQILRVHVCVWLRNIVRAQHNSWLPMQLVGTQNLPERVSPPPCLGVRNLWAGVGKMWVKCGYVWVCEDAHILCGYVGTNVHPCVQYIWACR